MYSNWNVKKEYEVKSNCLDLTNAFEKHEIIQHNIIQIEKDAKELRFARQKIN